MGNGAGKPAHRVTLADVARAAGLSPTTVSLALNRQPDQCHLSEATRQKAIEAAQRLGYRPNWRARALAKQQTFTTGLIYAAERSFITPTNEFIATSLAHRLYQDGYHQLLVPVVAGAGDWRDVLRPDRLDGCLLVWPTPADVDTIVAEIDLPMVMINLRSDLPVPQVLADDRGGMRQLMAHLLELGHRRIAMIPANWRPEHYSAVHRREEYLKIMQEAGLAAHARLVSPDATEDLVNHLARDPRAPTAVVCHDHVLAIRLLHACWRRGVAVPARLSVAAFNDVYPTSVTHPPLTTVRIPGEDLGRRAAHMLIQLIAQRRRPEARPPVDPPREHFAEKLIIRESTARPAE